MILIHGFLTSGFFMSGTFVVWVLLGDSNDVLTGRDVASVLMLVAAVTGAVSFFSRLSNLTVSFLLVSTFASTFSFLVVSTFASTFSLASSFLAYPVYLRATFFSSLSSFSVSSSSRSYPAASFLYRTLSRVALAISIIFFTYLSAPS